MNALRRILTAASLVSAAVATDAVGLLAADGPALRSAATELKDVDGDFAFQGEYYGPLSTSPGGPAQVVGLQVVALGSGKFQSVEYPGGLPGIGWYGGVKTPLAGLRGASAVTLLAPGRHYEVAQNSARLLDEKGQSLGTLNKVQRLSRTLGQAPPPGALVLFDGRSTEAFTGGEMTADGLLKEGATTKDAFANYFLHLEFRLSYMPEARKQGRSNSGVYLQRRYEVQILDSFGLEGENNECGALYKFRRPDINMCLPPLAWQTYDIDFRSPRFGSNGLKLENARVSVWHNGYPVQDNVDLLNKTGGGAPEGPELLPILLQKHGGPVRFRNIWLVPEPQPTPPVLAVFPADPLSLSTPESNAAKPYHRDYWMW
jgi:hypothetical protein